MSANYKIIASILALSIIVGGVYWIRTPHLSSGITLQSETPDTPEELTKLVIVIKLFDKRGAQIFAEKFAEFSGQSGGIGGLKKHEFYFGLYNVTFYGKDRTHIEFNMPFKYRYKTEILSETQCIEKADQLIEEINDYFNSSLEYRVDRVEKIYPTFEFGTAIRAENPYYYNRIYYDIYYDGVELLGKGTDAWVEICDKEILGYQLHFPVLEERGLDKVYLTPIEALNRLDSGSVVKDVKFGYYTDFVEPDNLSVVEYGYLVKGVLDGEYMERFVSAMAGNAYS